MTLGTQVKRYAGATEQEREAAFAADAAQAARAGWVPVGRATETGPAGTVLVVTYAPAAAANAPTQPVPIVPPGPAAPPPAAPAPPPAYVQPAPAPPPAPGTMQPAFAPAAPAGSLDPRTKGGILVLLIGGIVALVLGAVVRTSASGTAYQAGSAIAYLGVGAVFAAGAWYAWARPGRRSPLRLGLLGLCAFLVFGSVLATASVFGNKAPTGVPIAVTSHDSGQTVTTQKVTVRGTSGPNATIVHDVSLAPDDHATADASGNWTLTVTLKEGANDLVFREGDITATEVHLSLVYAPVAQATATPAPTAAPTSAPTSAPTEAPTAAATESPTDVPSTGLNDADTIELTMTSLHDFVWEDSPLADGRERSLGQTKGSTAGLAEIIGPRDHPTAISATSSLDTTGAEIIGGMLGASGTPDNLNQWVFTELGSALIAGGDYDKSTTIDGWDAHIQSLGLSDPALVVVSIDAP